MPSLFSLESASLTVEITLSSPRSRSDPPLSRQGVALAHIDSFPPHDLVLWTDGSVSFLFGKGGSGVLANCSLCGTEATLSFSACPVCSSFSAEACTILYVLCWSRQHNKSAISLVSSYYLTLFLSSPPCFLIHLFSYLNLFGRFCRNYLLPPPVLSDYNRSPDIRFSRVTTRLMSWPDGVRYLRPPHSLVMTFLLSLVFTLYFSRTGGILSYLNSSMHRLPRFPSRSLCSLVMLAVSSLAFAGTDAAFC